MTDEELAAIEQRETAATRGPWEFSSKTACIESPYGTIGIPSFSLNFQSDMRFAAHARMDVPALLAETRRLKADRKRLRDWWVNHYGSTDQAIDATTFAEDLLG